MVPKRDPIIPGDSSGTSQRIHNIHEFEPQFFERFEFLGKNIGSCVVGRSAKPRALSRTAREDRLLADGLRFHCAVQFAQISQF